jgi:hypothetical protein
MPRIDGPAFEVGRTAHVTQADFAELSRRRKETARADMAVLSEPVHHVDQRVQCEWCRSKVFTFGSTPDNARHYCRTCVRSIKK